MSKKILVLLAAGACLTVTAAFASEEAPTKATDSRRICRDSGRQLGSHIRATPRCRTAEQWRV